MSGGWNTIESDAGVFTFLLDNLGVKDVQFEELITLDGNYLSNLAPLYGVIFLFKYESSSDAPYRSSTPQDGTFDHDAAQSIFFAAQTIQNACGTQALLSVLLNQDASSSSSPNAIDIGPQLRDFKEFTSVLPAEFRGEALSNSELIRDVHNSFARSSPFVDESSHGNTGESEDVFHFIAYTPVNGTLYELDGLQEAPISHGTCDIMSFPERVVEVIQHRVSRYPAGEIRFNLLAMIKDPRIRAREIGDMETLEREERRRKEWLEENALRRWNFIGFTNEILKKVVKAKVEEGSYEAWINDAKGVTKARAEAVAGRRKANDDDIDMGSYD